MTIQEEREVRRLVGADWAKVIIFLLCQTFAFGYWCAKIDNKLEALTNLTEQKNYRIMDRVSNNDARITRLETAVFVSRNHEEK